MVDNSNNPATATGLPGDDNLLAKLQKRYEQHDKVAKKSQRSRLTFAFFAAALGPIAVALLSIQAIFFPDEGELLIAGELLALAVALAMGFLELTKSHASWIRARMRAEILRREMFLLQMRVGPYLLKASEVDVDQRLLVIDADEREPEDSLAPRDEEHGNWQACLEDQWRKGTATSIPHPLRYANHYLETRVCNQRAWLNKMCGSHGRSARYWENGAKLVLLLALVIAAVHLGMLLVPDPEHTTETLHNVLIIAAICLPPARRRNGCVAVHSRQPSPNAFLSV